jgi:hypothetical protein
VFFLRREAQPTWRKATSTVARSVVPCRIAINIAKLPELLNRR